MGPPASTTCQGCPKHPHRLSDFPPHDHTHGINHSSSSTGHDLANTVDPAESRVKSQTSENSTLATSAAPELEPDVSSSSELSSSNSIAVHAGSEPSCSRTSIESIMLGHPHPYRVDDPLDEGNNGGEATRIDEKSENSSLSFPQVLMDQVLADAITKLNLAKARRVVTPKTTENDQRQQTQKAEAPSGTKKRKSVRSDSYPSLYYGPSNHDEKHDEYNDEDDFVTNTEAWKLETEMTFALNHLQACTECWTTFERLSAAKKEADRTADETAKSDSPEFSHERLEHALGGSPDSWTQHKQFMIEFREGAHHDATTASTSGTTLNAECVFRIGLEHLKTCARCPDHLVTPGTAPQGTQDLSPQEETCWICGREGTYPALELPRSAAWGGGGSSDKFFQGSCYSCQENFGGSPPPAPYCSWQEFHAGRISPAPCQCSSGGLEDNFDRCVSPTPSRWLASSPQYYPKGLELSHHGSDSANSSRRLPYSPPRGLELNYDGLDIPSRSSVFSPRPSQRRLNPNIDRRLSPDTPSRSQTFSSSRQASFGSSLLPAQDSDNGSTQIPRHSSFSSIEHKCICFKCSREPFELSESPPLVSGMRSPRSSTPALTAASTFVPPAFHRSFSQQSLNRSSSQAASLIIRNHARAPPPSPAISSQAAAGPSGYRRQFRQARNNDNSDPATPSSTEKKFKFTFPGKKVSGMPGHSPSPLDLNVIREPKPRRAMPSMVEVLSTHPCLDGNFNSSPPLPEEDKKG